MLSYSKQLHPFIAATEVGQRLIYANLNRRQTRRPGTPLALEYMPCPMSVAFRSFGLLLLVVDPPERILNRLFWFHASQDWEWIIRATPRWV